MCQYCGFCNHATNRREWEDKIDYGNGRYDIVYCEEITCEIDGTKYHPMQFGCNGEYLKNKVLNGGNYERSFCKSKIS